MSRTITKSGVISASKLAAIPLPTPTRVLRERGSFASTVSAVCFDATRGRHEYVDLTKRSRPSALFSMAHAFLHGFCQLLLVLGQQRFNLVVRFIADRVDLRAEIFA
ncbi:MAG: hypothetical protein JWO48_347 [Bryobacterales bacterium]|nr:hypothetical protein [Bryobacterales bacterium]